MKVYKYFLLVLAFLFFIALIFSPPGRPALEIYYKYFVNFYDLELLELIRYPPGVYSVYFLLDIVFGPLQQLQYFYLQNVWIASKVLLAVLYLFTLAVFLLFKKLKITKLSYLDIFLAYVLCVPIAISLFGYNYFDYLAAPFFVLSLASITKKKKYFATVLFLVSVFFNWSFVVLFPLYYVFLHNNNDRVFIKYLKLAVFIFIPVLVLLAYTSFYSAGPILKSSRNGIFGFNWLFLEIYEKSKLSTIYNLNTAKQAIVAAIIFFAFYCYLVRKLLNRNRVSSQEIVSAVLAVYFLFVVFTQNLSEGNLVYLCLISLVIYLKDTSKENLLQYTTVSFIVFINYFLFFGTNGFTPYIRPNYLETFRVIFSLMFVVYYLYYYIRFVQTEKSALPVSINRLFLILILILFNLSLIPSQGTVDVSIMGGFNRILADQSNPFLGHTLIGNYYPPLSSVFFWSFTIIWRSIVGFGRLPSVVISEYAIPAKIGIFFFFSLFLILLTQVKRICKKIKVGWVDAVFVFLLTISIGIQSNGLADTDIVILPFLFLSIFKFFDKKYILSALLLAISCSIKWQAFLVAPLFLATLIDIRNVKHSIKPVFAYFFVFAAFVMGVWAIVLLQPAGASIFKRDFIGFFLKAPPYFSGQAMNLNWVVTYVLKITNPDAFGTLASSHYMNWHIGNAPAPKIFKGYFFYLVSFVVLTKYLFQKNKNAKSFLATLTILFFSHHMLNKGAYDNHFFYVTASMFMLYLVSPTVKNRIVLIMFDAMNLINQVMFFGTTGHADINRVIYRVDITVAFSIVFLIIYFYYLFDYLGINKKTFKNLLRYLRNMSPAEQFV